MSNLVFASALAKVNARVKDRFHAYTAVCLKVMRDKKTYQSNADIFARAFYNTQLSSHSILLF